jgi:hypothetical protein
MEEGHEEKKKRYCWKLLRMCDEWRGSVRIGCGGREGGEKKMSKTSTLFPRL